MSNKKSVRVRSLEVIAKKNMTAAQVQAAIGLGHGLKPTLDQEVERGHLKTVLGEEGAATTYSITASGKTALKNGTVDPKRGPGSSDGKPSKGKASKGKKASPKAKAKKTATEAANA